MDAPKVTKESKNKIRVDFERAPLWERIKGKYFSMRFLKGTVYVLFRFILLLGVSFVILYPYISKIADSFKDFYDFQDITVVYISKNPSFQQYATIITENHYFHAMLNTFLISASTALIQTLVCALIGYGLAKFKFRGRGVIFAIVIITMMLPQDLLRLPMQNVFWRFDDTHPIGMFVKWVSGDPDLSIKFGVNSLTGFIPHYILSITGFGFRNGLFIFLLRQFFTGVPDELEESAYMDGCTTFRTFFQIIIPLAIPMLITVFIFSFSWQWTDDFYINTFWLSDFWTSEDSIPLLSSGNFANKVPDSLFSFFGQIHSTKDTGWDAYVGAIGGTTTILIALPLIIAFVFLQGKIVQGIERSGIVG
ncbi:MAG: carbohydrate ABC transporter permease [Clostridia bacterium]|nr:carbohydrate ABC transporter permease [Clostridia bacterium]